MDVHTHTHTHAHTHTHTHAHTHTQEEDRHKAQLIEFNVDLVERACVVIRSAIANAMDWGDIELLVKDAQTRGDPVAVVIHSLKLASNEFTLILRYINYSFPVSIESHDQ